jgi:CrcB protein
VPSQNVVFTKVHGSIWEISVTTKAALPDVLRLTLAVGFLGAYTTFSTFSVETLNLGQRSLGYAALNVILNNGLALLGAAMGMAVARLRS